MSSTVNIRDISPLEHITSDLAKARFNYESILNGLVAWNASDNDVVTVRLATDTDPGFVDYTFPTRKAYSGGTSLFGLSTVAGTGCFDVDNRLTLPVTPGGTGMYSDEVNLRLTPAGSGGYRWRIFEDIDIHQEDDMSSASRAYVYGDHVVNDGKVYIVTSTVAAGGDLGGSQEQVREQWITNESYARGTVALYRYPGTTEARRAYVLVGTNGQYAPPDSSDWVEMGVMLNDVAIGERVEQGRAYVYKDGSDKLGLYIYRGMSVAKTDAGPVPVDGLTGTVSDSWYGPVAVKPTGYVERPTVIRHTPSTDLRGFIARRESGGTGTGELRVSANVAFRAPEMEPSRGMRIFDTSNYALWPDNLEPVWRAGNVYGYDDDYSASMVFHYTDTRVRRVNIVNYDGPDLDRGLCIYLPEEDTASDGQGNTVVSGLKDGSVIEFMFRIWPSTVLNGSESADLIVNKAQIYVYSLPDASNLATGKVIAKFSMARVTNFYVWAENVAIPNRPVFYKARFIYSAEHGEWKTYDYYQIPDHVFLAPKGFVDPSLRLYAEDGTYTGLETAGFPLMQDPFGGMDLSRIRLNRIEEDAEEPPGE